MWKFTLRSVMAICAALILASTTNAQISGTRTIGASGDDYTTIEAALAAINGLGGVNGPLVFELQSDYSGAGESYPIGIAAITGASGTNTITIRPAAGVTGLSISASTNETINNSGGDYIIFDGRPGGVGTSKELTISNTSTGGVVFLFSNDATNNVLRYLTITGVTTSGGSGIIFFSTTGGTTGNDDNTISNCILKDGATTPTNIIYSAGTAAKANSGNVISNNEIANFVISTQTASGILIGDNNDNWTISGNSFYQSASRNSIGANTNIYCINIADASTGNSFNITDNYIGGSASGATGTWTQTPASTTHVFQGIRLNGSSTTTYSVQGNIIKNLNIGNSTTTSVVGGIALIKGIANIGTISGNTIGDMSSTGNIVYSNFSTGAFSGMAIGSGANEMGNVTIQNNQIGGISVSGNFGAAFRGINMAGTVQTAATNCIISGNIIGGTVANSIQNTGTGTTYGILNFLTSAIWTPTISGNTIRNISSTNAGVAAYRVTGIGITASSACTVSGNRIYNLSSTNTNTTTTAPILSGIQGTSNIQTIINNQISISQSTASTQPRIYGIELGTTANNVRYNTIYIGGTAAAANATFGIWRTTTGAANVQNNFIYNERTGFSTHFAIGYGSAGAFGTINNNVYITADATTVGQAATVSRNLTDWRTSTSQEAATSSYLSTAAPNSLFTDLANGDLSIVSTNGYRGLVAGRGADLDGTDYTGAARHATSPSAGSIEYTYTGGIFMGATNSDYGTASNWNDNVVPTGATNVTVPPYASNMPILSANGECNNLVIASGAALTIGANTLTINGAVSGSGTITGSASSNLTIGGTAGTLNFTPGFATLNNFNIGNSNSAALGANVVVEGTFTADAAATLTIGSNTLTLNGAVSGTGTLSGSASSNLTIGGTAGTLNFTSGARTLKDLTLGASATATLGTALAITGGASHGIVTVGSSGTLTTGGNLTLKSDANGTAMIGNSAGSISGEVVVERFISAQTNTNRAYRLLSPSVNTTGGSKPFIRDNWQEGTNNTAQITMFPTNNNNPVANYGTHITGTAGTAGGFDETLNNPNSLFLYNTGTWTGIANTNAINLDAKTGYLLYIRGDREIDLSQTAALQGSRNTTLRATGSVLNGNESFSGLGGVDTWHLLGNPFPAPLNWANISATNGTTNFYDYYTLWDPNVGSRGGYIQVQTDGTRSPNSGAATIAIQSGQAFFVRTKTAGPHSFAVNQAHKATTNTNDIFRVGNQYEKFSANMFYTGTDAIRRLADGIVAVYNNTYGTAVDERDAEQIANWDEDVAIVREGKSLSIEKRPLIDNNDTLFLNIARLREINYEWEFVAENFNAPGLTAYVQDAFTNTETAISLTGTTVVPFTVTANAASKAANRFRVVYRTSGVLPVTLTNVKAFQQNNGITVAWNTQNESAMKQYEVEKSTNGTSFSKAATQLAQAGTSNSYSWFDANTVQGNNYYRIKAISQNGTVKNSNIVVVKLGDKGTGLSVYPNPVKGNTVSVSLSGLTKGNYTLSVFNQLGQQVLNRVVAHNGGNATQTFDLSALAAGVYELRLSNGTTVFTEKLIKE